MAIFLFLSFCILSYFVFEKFLRRFFKFSVYHLTYDDVYESYLIPATDFLAGCGELWELPFNSLSNSLHLPASLTSNRFKIFDQNAYESRPVIKFTTLLNNYHKKYGTKEEQELKKKERLYNINLRKRLRLHNRPKTRNRRNVGYLPTIYESLPYPLTAESIIKYPSENTDVNQKPEDKYGAEIVTEESCNSDKKKKKKSFFRRVKNLFKKFHSVHKVKKHSTRKFSCYIENCQLH